MCMIVSTSVDVKELLVALMNRLSMYAQDHNIEEAIPSGYYYCYYY